MRCFPCITLSISLYTVHVASYVIIDNNYTSYIVCILVVNMYMYLDNFTYATHETIVSPLSLVMLQQLPPLATQNNLVSYTLYTPHVHVPTCINTYIRL